MTNELVKTVNNKAVMDSRDIADIIGKRHDNLVRDIEGYVNVMNQTSKLRADDFFIKKLK